MPMCFCILPFCLQLQGAAATVVKRQEKTQDGRLAWLSLRKWYEGQGSKNSIARRALQTLQTLTLAKDIVGGVVALHFYL